MCLLGTIPSGPFVRLFSLKLIKSKEDLLRGTAHLVLPLRPILTMVSQALRQMNHRLIRLEIAIQVI